MKTYTFPTGGSLGGGESWDGSIDFTLTDEEAARLEASANAEPRWELDEDESITDIYEKVRAFAFEENKKIMLKAGIIDELRRDRDYYANLSDDAIVAEEMGSWNVSYPLELQELGDEEDDMKTYTFPWQCDEIYGDIELEITDEEVELIKAAHRDAFVCLEEVSDLDDLRDRAVQELDFYDPEADQDIRIFFPEEIENEADEENDL